MSTSYSVKQQMITAIATILEFSPKEVNVTYLCEKTKVSSYRRLA